MSETTFIYGLFDPRNYSLRYIGKSDNPNLRLKQHIHFAINRTKSRSHKDKWLRSLLSERLEPSIEILEEVSIDKWEEAESAWIAECREFGLNLTNETSGGDGTKGISAEARISMSESHKGKQFTDEHKQSMKEAWARRKAQHGSSGFTSEGLDRIRARQKRWIEENREAFDKKNEALRGKPRSEEVKEKLRQANLGKKHTEETKKKMSEANKGRIPPMKGKKWPPEMIELFREKSTGRPQSEEQLRKKSESLKAFYAKKRLESKNDASDS